jgi:hypothetical protein
MTYRLSIRSSARFSTTDSDLRGPSNGSLTAERPLGASARLHFHALDHEQQQAAIVRLATTGMSDRDISDLTGLALEVIHRVLAEQEAA